MSVCNYGDDHREAIAEYKEFKTTLKMVGI